MAKAKYKPGKDGVYRTKSWDGTYNKDGSKHRINLKSTKSSRDLEMQVNALRQKVENRQYVNPSDISFYDYAKKWRKVWKSSDPDNKSNTAAMYDNIIEKHFVSLNHTRLQDIGRIHFQSVLSDASGKPRTQQQIYMTFNQILRSAISDRLLPANLYDDIISGIDRIRYDPPEKRPLNPSEKKALFKADFKYERDKVFCFILFGCGLRRGEAIALTVFDFNLKKHSVTINKAVAFDVNNPYLKDTKSKYGVRGVPIPPSVRIVIESYVELLKSQGRTKLFSMPGGGYMTKSSYDKMWTRIATSITQAGGSDEGLCKLTAHIFRHNYTTSLCYQIPTISIKMIAHLVGDTEAVVLKVYNHIMLEKEDADQACANALSG